jgi:hypothetical protein
MEKWRKKKINFSPFHCFSFLLNLCPLFPL